MKITSGHSQGEGQGQAQGQGAEDAGGTTTIQKLFRVISLVHDAYVPTPPPPPDQPSETTRPRPSPSRQTIDLSLTPPNYATIVRLLGSAIVDLTSAPIQLGPAHPAAISWPDVCHDEPVMAPDSPLPISGPSNSSPQPASPPTTSQSLIGIGDKEVKSLPNASNTFLNLPGEVHARIFREARKFSTDPKAWPAVETEADKLPTSSNETWPDDEEEDSDSEYHPLLEPWHVWHEINHDAGADASGSSRVGGKLHAQEFSHSMALVASSLVPIARTVGFERMYITSRKQVEHLVKLWSGQLDVKVEAKGSGQEGPTGEPKRNGLSIEKAGNDGVDKALAEEHVEDELATGVDRDVIDVEQDECQVKVDKGKQKAKEEPSLEENGEIGEEKVEDQSQGLMQGSAQSSASTLTPTASTGKMGEGSLARSSTNLGQYVLHVDIQVTTAKPETCKHKDRFNEIRRISLRHATAFTKDLADIQDARQLALETERDQLARMIRLMPNLKSLVLDVRRNKYSLVNEGFEGGISKIGYGLDGLEGELLNSICSLTSLTTLILLHSIDFSEIVILLQSLPGLKDLRIRGGVQCADGSSDVDTDVHHFCKLKTFILYTPTEDEDVTLLSSEQLDWILTPSVGTIVELDLAFLANPSILAQNQGWGVEGPENVFAYWATNVFANLIVRLGPTLKSLMMRGCSYVASTDPSLQVEPHQGFMDHALSYCTRLEYLAIDFCLTGPKFLASLTSFPNTENTSSKPNSRNGTRLKSLTVFGRPRHTSAIMFRTILEKSEPAQLLPLLKSLALIDFPTQRVNLISWPSKEIRKIQNICRRRKIWFAVATVYK